MEGRRGEEKQGKEVCMIGSVRGGTSRRGWVMERSRGESRMGRGRVDEKRNDEGR